MKPYLTAIIEKEDDMFVGLCPELDIASQGSTVEETKANLQEAVELFFECTSAEEIKKRLHYEVFISPLEVNLGKTAFAIG
jgi:predicted RNase H-like HicB family nuclease